MKVTLINTIRGQWYLDVSKPAYRAKFGSSGSRPGKSQLILIEFDYAMMLMSTFNFRQQYTVQQTYYRLT